MRRSAKMGWRLLCFYDKMNPFRVEENEEGMRRLITIVGFATAGLMLHCTPAHALQQYRRILVDGVATLRALFPLDSAPSAAADTPQAGGRSYVEQHPGDTFAQDLENIMTWKKKVALTHRLMQDLNDFSRLAPGAARKIPPQEAQRLKRLNDLLLKSYRTEDAGMFLQRCQEAARSIESDEKESSQNQP